MATTEITVAGIPVSAFYGLGQQSGIVRFCFVKQEQTLRQALERLAQLKGAIEVVRSSRAIHRPRALLTYAPAAANAALKVALGRITAVTLASSSL